MILKQVEKEWKNLHLATSTERADHAYRIFSTTAEKNVFVGFKN